MRTGRFSDAANRTPPPTTRSPRGTHGHDVEADAARDVLATRHAGWARALARRLGRAGVRPNAVSIASVVFALVAGVAFSRRRRPLAPGSQAAALLVAAAAIQLRLLCNLLDGMLAVEEGLKTRTGDIYNDLPDRVADVLILVGAGYSIRYLPGGATLGWAAAVVALFTAYVRAARRLARRDAALHRPDGEAASHVHADARGAARGGRSDARPAAAGHAASAWWSIVVGIDRDRLRGAPRASCARLEAR